MKKIATTLIILILLILNGCATTSSSHIQSGKESELKQITAIAIEQFQSSDEVVSQAVRNTIIGMLLPSGIRIVTNKASADVIIQGTITFSYDAAVSGGMFVGQRGGSAYTSGTAGGYVSGITAKLIKGDDIIAALSETQVRTDLWIPDPPEVMARKIGNKIKEMLGR